jgi:mannosyltransferase OCH1-like enzyme
MIVPPILSQTWITQTLPPRASALREKWAALNPNLSLRLYDDAASRAVIAEMVPDHLPTYDAMPYGVMRADLFRLAVVLRDGGVYADIDMQPLRPLPPDLFMRPSSMSVEARLGGMRQRELRYRRDYQIANCIFAARSGHPFLQAALEYAFACANACPQPRRDQIEDITGPRMLTRLLQQGDWADVWIGSQIQLMAPLDLPDLWPLNRHIVARHETHGTWKTDTPTPATSRRKWVERNRLVNPFRAPRWVPATDFWARA